MSGERTALLIATLDTKGAEAGFLKTRLEAAGISVLVMNPSILSGAGERCAADCRARQYRFPCRGTAG